MRNIRSSMTNHLSGGEILEGRVIVGLQLHDRLQTLGWQHWEAVLPEVSGGEKLIQLSNNVIEEFVIALNVINVTHRSLRLFNGRKASSWISEMLFFSMSLYKQFKISLCTFFFLNISKIVSFLLFESYNICRFWSPVKTFSDRAFILFLK